MRKMLLDGFISEKTSSGRARGSSSAVAREQDNEGVDQVEKALAGFENKLIVSLGQNDELTHEYQLDNLHDELANPVDIDADSS